MPNHDPEGPILSAPGNPHLLGEAGSPNPYSLLLSGPANLGPSPPLCLAHPGHQGRFRARVLGCPGGLVLARWAHYKILTGERGVTHPLLTGRGCAVPFCLCNINTDFYTSPLWLLVLSIPAFDSLPRLSALTALPGPVLSDPRGLWASSCAAHHLDPTITAASPDSQAKRFF